VPFVDNAAHVGGFAGGLALGVLLRPPPSAWGAAPRPDRPPGPG